MQAEVVQIPDVEVRMIMHTHMRLDLSPHSQIHVSRVQVAGLKRTKNDIVVEQIKDVLQATSLKDLFIKALSSMERLQDMKVFKTVSMKIDTDKRENKEGVEVTFLVQELGWLKSTLAAHAGTQSGDAVSHNA